MSTKTPLKRGLQDLNQLPKVGIEPTLPVKGTGF